MEKIRRRENRLNTHLGEILERVSIRLCVSCVYTMGLCVCVCDRLCSIPVFAMVCLCVLCVPGQQ